MVAFASTGRAGDIAYYLGSHTEECEKLAKAPSRDSLMLQLGTLLAKIEPGEEADDDDDDGDGRAEEGRSEAHEETSCRHEDQQA